VRCCIATFLVALTLPASARARVDGPYLDNETIGLWRSLRDAAGGPPDEWDDRQWALQLLQRLEQSGTAMSNTRYLIAFPAYAAAQTARLSPAWREPYRKTMDAFIARMLQPPAWRDWIERWNGSNPFGPDNIMWTGHLALMTTLHRQLFGDPKYENPFTVALAPAHAYTTDARALARDIAAQAAGNLDTAGAHYYGVACEPGRVFVPCNTPHRVAQLVSDRMYGTDLARSNADWLAWVRTNMLDATGVLHDLYWPFGEDRPHPGDLPPRRDESARGVYNAWSLWFLTALDPAWAAELHGPFKARFAKRGADSPFADGRTVIVDDPGAQGAMAGALNVLATGFGLSESAAAGDAALHNELRASWDAMFGAPRWSDDGTVLSCDGMLYPLVFQNGFALLGRTTAAGADWKAAAAGPVDDGRFRMPFVEGVDDERVFVNQAFYDEASRTLTITVNGGRATAGPVRIAIANLDETAGYEVKRDGTAWDDVDRSGTRMTLATGALSARESTFTVARTGGGCGCTGAGAGSACLAMLAALGARRRRE